LVNKQFCDKCGTEVYSTDNEIHFTKYRHTRFGYDNLIHLCDDCLKRFDKFLSEK
jgi:5-methylcytosine-specific restriction endonuclease McrA